MLTPLALYRRWRHGYGYGVHSPFAYGLITEVINQPCAYYAYEQFRAMPRRHEARTAALLYRLAVHFAPRRVWVSDGPAAEALRAILSLADPATAFTADPAEADMLVVADSDMPPFEATQRAGSVTVVLDTASPRRRAFADQIMASARGGMSFSHNSFHPFIYANLPGLPRQHFSLRYHRGPL